MTSPTRAAPDRPAPGRLDRARLWRGLAVHGAFVLATVVVYAVDLLLTIPRADERDGHHWQAFGVVDVSIGLYGGLLAGVYAVLLLRRRHPVVVMTVMSVATTALSFVSPAARPLAGVMLALYAAAATVQHVWLSRAVLLLATVAVVVPVPFQSDRGLAPPLAMGVLAAAVLGVWLIGRHQLQVEREAVGLRGELAQVEEQAAIEERRRIARELHDILAHSVSAMMMQAAGARAVVRGIVRDQADGADGAGRGDGDGGRGVDPRWAAVEQALTSVEETGTTSMRELQRLLGVLHQDGPAEREVVSSPPGMDSVDELVRITRSSGVLVEVHRTGRPRQPDGSVGLAAYRVIQESLANAMKHAGHGALVDLFVTWGADELQLQVRCRPGPEGFLPDTGGGGNGLAGLRQRVELVGGRFDAGRTGEEFVTTADLPLVVAPADGGAR